MIFVFGSNLAGRHGAGAALYAAKYHGAIRGIGLGIQGNSYGIPTKGETLHTLPLNQIKRYVGYFMQYADNHRSQEFQVTCIGCGLAGLKHEDIAPMFVTAPNNCLFDTLWKPWLGEDKRYWGTF